MRLVLLLIALLLTMGPMWRAELQAAITMTALTSGSSTTAGTSFTTASVDPAAGGVVIICIGQRAGVDNTPVPTVTHNGSPPLGSAGNATQMGQINTQPFNSGAGTNRRRVSAFYGNHADAGAGTITLAFGSTVDSLTWSVWQLAGVDDGNSGNNAIVQSAINKDDVGGTGLTMTLAAFGSVNNGAVSCAMSNTNTTATPEAAWTEIHDLNTATQVQTLHSMWRADNDTTATHTFAASATMGGVAAEIKQAVAGGGTPGGRGLLLGIGETR